MANNIFDDLCDSVLKLIKKRERGVKQDYKAAYRRLRNKLQKIYADYEDEEDGVKISIDKFKALDREASRIIAQMYKKNEAAVQNTLESVLNASYKSVNTITSKYNIEAVARKIDANNIIKKQVAGHIWTERIKKYGNDFVYDVHGIIHQGLDNGDTYTTTVRKLKERFGKDIGNTMRIARTESARVLEDSKYQAFEDLAGNENVKVFKVWHTMGDEAVRDTHEAMEGVKVAYDEDFILPSGAKCQYPKGTGVAAEDINCRCYVEYVTELVKDIKPESLQEEPDKKESEEGKDNIENLVYVKAKTVKEANKFAESMGFEADYTGINIKCANEWNKGLYDMKTKYPEITDDIRFVGSTQARNKKMREAATEFYKGYYKEMGFNDDTATALAKKKGNGIINNVEADETASSISSKHLRGLANQDLAKALEDCKGITMNKSKFNNYEDVIKIGNRQVEIKNWPEACNNVKSTFDHEFAHQIDDYLGVRNNEEIIKLFNENSKDKIKDGLSEYAGTNIGDFIAEAWREYCNNPKPREMATKVGKVVEKLWEAKK